MADNARRRLPDPQTLSEIIELQKRDRDFIEANYEQLLEEHRDRWIVVSEGEVIAYGKEPRALLRRLSERGFEIDRVTLQFMAERPEVMLL